MSENNAMHNEKHREKARLAKTGTKRLNKDNKFKFAREHSERWNELILAGWEVHLAR